MHMSKDTFPLDRFASKTHWVLDVDDCLYDMSCGLHQAIKSNIVNAFNRAANTLPNGKDLRARLYDATGLDTVSENTLAQTFMPMSRILSDMYPEHMDTLVPEFYGNSYNVLRTDSQLVRSFMLAKMKGITVHLYTNGPTYNAEKVLKHLGVHGTLAKDIMDRCYDLLMSTAAGHGKPDAKGMENFLEFSGIDPTTAFMADDTIHNLKTAADYGIAPLWTWTTDIEPSHEQDEIAKSIDATRVRYTGPVLLRIANAYRP